MKMSRGTILYIGGFELPDKNAAAHRVLNNGKALSELGYKVVFIGIDKSLKFPTNIITTNKQVQGFESWSIPYPKSTRQWINYLSSIKSFLQIYKEYSDVECIICYNYQSLAFEKIRRFSRLKNIKLYADCTEWYGPQGNNKMMKALKGIDSFIRMRIIHKRIDGIIVISKYLENYYSKVKKTILIPPLVDLSEEKWSIPINIGKEKVINLIYAGSPGKKDSINLIINSLDNLKDKFNFSFNIIGISEVEYLGNYPEDVRVLENLKGKINFFGRLNHIDSLEHLANSNYSIFVRENNLPNRAGFPTKFVESVSCGTKVITNSSSNITDYLVEGENGHLLRTHSIEDMSKDLSKIFLRGENESAEMTEAQKKIFDYKNYNKEFKKIF